MRQAEDFSQRFAQKATNVPLPREKTLPEPETDNYREGCGGKASLLSYPMKNTLMCFGGRPALGLRDSLQLRTSTGLHDKGSTKNRKLYTPGLNKVF